MTDNRTTEQTAAERLCALLDERGVKYKNHYLNTSWYAGMKLYMATDNMDGTLTVNNLMPEQAIAATLGGIEEPDGGLIADVLAPVCVDEKERRAFERGRVHERFAQQIFKETTS